MSNARALLARPILLAAVGVASLAMLILALSLLIWVTDSVGPDPPAAPGGGVVAAGDANVAPVDPAKNGNRFTLRLGQGFRFRDGVVVAAPSDAEPADVVFKYVPPHVGGMALRYNPISQQVEQGLEPTLTSPMPLLLSTHIQAFDAKPDVARTTSGDAAGYPNQAPIAATTRFVLLMSAAGDAYLLALDELEAVPDKYDDWRIGFAYEPVQLPVGLPGGKVNAPLPGRLVFRDWYRTKMIVRVDLTTGKEEVLADGTLPSSAGEGLLGYGDASGAYVVRDAAGATPHTIRFNEQVLGPVLSPDGARLLGSVYRPGPTTNIGGTELPTAPVLAVAIFDRAGRELVSISGYDDAAWTPDGKVIATGALYDPGLFELDPATKHVRPIGAQIGTALQPSVSPDGKTIAFVTGERVWLIDRDGKDLRQLYPHGQQQQRPAFSPDGTKLALVVCNTMAYDVTGEVFVIDVKTQAVTPLRTNTGVALVPDPTTRLNWVE